MNTHLKKASINIPQSIHIKKKTKVLVTGGAGFIGSHVAEWLLDDQYDVYILDDLSGGFKENVPEGSHFIKGSITDVVLLEKIFNEHKFEYVFHLAAYAAEGLSHFIRRYNYMTNLVGSINLINLAVKHKVKCFVFTSSIAVYGQNQLPMTEDLIPMPEDPYGISKLAVELDLVAARKQFGLDHIIFRPHNVYGERQNIGDKYRNVLGIFMNNILIDKPLTIFGDGTQTRAFTHIDDVAPIIARSVNDKRKYGEVFNIGADVEVSVKELAHHVCKAFDVEPNIKYLRGRNEVKHAYSSHSKLSKFDNITSQVPIEEGIKRMVDWVKRVGARKPKKFGKIEIVEGLPEGWDT